MAPAVQGGSDVKRRKKGGWQKLGWAVEAVSAAPTAVGGTKQGGRRERKEKWKTKRKETVGGTASVVPAVLERSVSSQKSEPAKVRGVASTLLAVYAWHRHPSAQKETE